MRRRSVARGYAWFVGVVLIGVLLGAGPVSGGSAAFPGRDGRIAFAWDPDVSVVPQSCFDIFSISPSGAGRRRLTRGCPWLYTQPAYSATGERIVFVRGEEPFPRHLHRAGIYVMNADGTHLRRVTASKSDQHPEFSPNGKWIVFDRFRKSSRRTQVYIAAAHGSHVRQLTFGQGASEPAFSPNGHQIALVGFGKRQGFNIYLMRLGRRHLRQLTHAPVNGWDDQPDFSPDGRRIVFRCGYGDFGASEQICILRADGTGLRHLTPAGPGGMYAFDPVFSPDGRRIAFLAQRYCRRPGCGDGHLILFTMQIDGSHRREVDDLGPNQGSETVGVSWQPLP